jgi:hypothetical protein
MKTIALIAAAASLAAFQADAQIMGQDQLAAIDANGDGAVSREEYDTYGARAFQRLDTNGDLSLSAAEMDGKISVPGLDADGDGMVSRQEFGRRMTTDFNSADKDGNGLID